MPQVFKVGAYWIYFWANEGKPLEPIHVHIAEGRPHQNNESVDYICWEMYRCE